MAAVKREWLWIAMAAALAVAVWFYRKRKAAPATVQSGVGSTIGSTIANQPSAPLPVSTIPIQGGVPLQYTGSNSSAGNVDVSGQVTSGLGGNAPVVGTSAGGTPVLKVPIFVRQSPVYQSPPIVVPKLALF